MAGAGSTSPGDAVPATSAARALEARRLHHRQMLRRGIITALVLAIMGVLTAIAIPVANQLRNSWVLEAAGFRVNWQIDPNNWMSGGVTTVRNSQRSWISGSHDQDLKMLPGLLNVQSLDLAECAVSEQGLSVLGDLPQLELVDLTRLAHLRYGSSVTALSDACLGPLQKLGRLQILVLSGNRITDDGLAMVSRMSTLESLDLTATDVTDQGLVHLKAPESAAGPASGADPDKHRSTP